MRYPFYRRLYVTAAIVAIWSAVAGSSGAGMLPVSLSNAVADSPFTIGSVVLTFNNVNPFGTQPPDLTGIEVNATGPPYPYPGFTLNGSIVTAVHFASPPSGLVTSDLSLEYTVHSNGAPITAVALSAVGSFTPGAGGSVGESIYAGSAAVGTPIASGSIFDSSGTIISLHGAYSTITVVKDILAFAGPVVGNDPFELASYSVITQGFTTPEPSSIVLFTLGTAGLYFVRRRRRSSA